MGIMDLISRVYRILLEHSCHTESEVSYGRACSAVRTALSLSHANASRASVHGGVRPRPAKLTVGPGREAKPGAGQRGPWLRRTLVYCWCTAAAASGLGPR